MSFEISSIPEQWTTLNDNGVCTVSAFLSALFGNEAVRVEALKFLKRMGKPDDEVKGKREETERFQGPSPPSPDDAKKNDKTAV